MALHRSLPEKPNDCQPISAGGAPFLISFGFTLMVLVWVIVGPRPALLSVGCTQSMDMVPLAIRYHQVPGVAETRFTRSSASIPVQVTVPAMAVVLEVPVAKVRVTSVLSLVGSVLVRLKKVVEPEMD